MWQSIAPNCLSISSSPYTLQVLKVLQPVFWRLHFQRLHFLKQFAGLRIKCINIYVTLMYVIVSS